MVVDDLSRLSRDRTDSAVLVRQLDDLSVKVIDAETGADSEDQASNITFAIKGVINSEYVKAIRRQTHRGLEGRVRSSRSGGARSGGGPCEAAGGRGREAAGAGGQRRAGAGHLPRARPRSRRACRSRRRSSPSYRTSCRRRPPRARRSCPTPARSPAT